MAPKDGKAMMMLTLAPGKTLEEAASNFLQQNNLGVLESAEKKVNGFNALAVVAEPKQDQQQQQQQQSLRALCYFIQSGTTTYLMMGLSDPNTFESYAPSFLSSMQNFKELTDPDKLNRKPERVRIKTVKQNTTLQETLKIHNVPEKRFEEIAILNGMKLRDKVSPGMLIKVIER